MDARLIREKLQSMSELIAEVLLMLPDEPTRPNLVLVKDDREDLPFMTKPSRARGGFPILCDSSGSDSEERSAETAFLKLTKKELSKLPKPFFEIYKPKGGKVTHIRQKQKGGITKTAFSKFQKEIFKMPKNLQEKIKKALTRAPRYHNRVYEKRAYINGILIFACSRDADECQLKFFDQLTEFLSTQRDGNGNAYPFRPSPTRILFSEFSERWFENIHKNKVVAETYSTDYATFKRHVLPFFGDQRLCSITSADCIDFISGMRAKGHDRTTESCDGLLRQVFQYAVDSELIRKNPMATIKRVKSERINGVPLTKDEEKAFLRSLRGTKYEALFVTSLYTGVRPCELPSVRIEGEFIVAQNRKQKNPKKIVFKKIPITPMLRPYLPKLREALQHWDELTSHNTSFYRDEFRRHCPGRHTFYDLRTTFATRCQECGASEQAVQAWMGHSPSTLLGRVYTKLSDEYLLSEGKKVKYE